MPSSGIVRASGHTRDLLERRDIADLLGGGDTSSIISAKVIAHDTQYHLTTLEVEDRIWSIPMHLPIAPGEATKLRVRARDVSLAKVEPEAISIRNVLPGTIVAIDDREAGPSVDCVVAAGETRIQAQITRASLDQLSLRVNDEVFALVKSVTLG